MLKFRYVYNDAKVKQYKDREIKRLNIELKTLISSFNQKIKSSKLTKKKYKKLDLKNLSIDRAFSIMNRPKILEEEKKKRKNEIEKKIGELKSMTLEKYIKYKEKNDIENFE